MRSASRSNGTWTRKKGVAQKSNSAVLPTASTGEWSMSKPRQKTIREYVEDIDKVAATLEPGGESTGGSPGEVQRVDRSIRADWGFDSPAHGQVDDQLSGRASRGAGKFEEIKDNARSRAMVSLAQKSNIWALLCPYLSTVAVLLFWASETIAEEGIEIVLDLLELPPARRKARPES